MIALSELIERSPGRTAICQNTTEPPGLVHTTPVRSRVKTLAELVGRWLGLLLAVAAAGCGESSGPRTSAAEVSAPTGTLAVSVGKNVDFDPNGYSLSVDGVAPKFVPAVFPGYEQMTRVAGLSAGVHRLSISGVAAHCAATPSRPIAFTVSAGTTTQVKIAIVCATTERPKAMPTARWAP